MVWEAKHARDLSAQIRGAFSSPTRTPQLSLVRPSPSSPADLANIANGRPLPPLITLPLTHFYPDREPARSAHRSPISLNQPSNERNTKGYNARNGIDLRQQVDDDWLEGDDELWAPPSQADRGIRPFSFAVRAGATAAKGSSDGHGRRTLWGRWGGSVTSLFGGSQGGSGSMMDMQSVQSSRSYTS